MNRNIIIGLVAGVIVIALAVVGFSKDDTVVESVKTQEVAIKELAKANTTKAKAIVKPETSSSAQNLYQEAVQKEKDRDLVNAREIYKEIYNEHADFDNIADVQKRLESVNMELILSNVPTKETVIHDVVSGDTLGKLAKKYKTTIGLIKKNNHLKSDIIRIGQKLRIWTGEFNIFVDKSQNILILKNGDEVVKVYDVSTGANNSTPVGDFKVTTKLIDPVWFNRGVVVPPESPANELGSRWLGLDIPGYGIHGTVQPDRIGQQVTAGCVRMRNEEVEELFTIIPSGTLVSIVD